MYEIYLDRWNRRWIRISEELVWNSEAGFGGWFDGSGLVSTIYAKGRTGY